MPNPEVNCWPTLLHPLATHVLYPFLILWSNFNLFMILLLWLVPFFGRFVYRDLPCEKPTRELKQPVVISRASITESTTKIPASEIEFL
jgi:uncharacterized SAM-binding protein YcdF (DUF218 family)